MPGRGLSRIRQMNRAIDYEAHAQGAPDAAIVPSILRPDDIVGWALVYRDQEDPSEWVYGYISSVLAALNGRPVADHIGMRVSELYPALAEAAYALFDQAIDNGSHVEATLEVEIDGVMKAFRVIYAIIVRPATGYTGAIAAFVAAA